MTFTDVFFCFLVVASTLSPTHVGKTVNLSCTLGHPMTSELEVKWTPPRDSHIKMSSPPHPVNLTISAVSVYDSGPWRCELIKNNTVLTSATVYLKIGEEIKNYFEELNVLVLY